MITKTNIKKKVIAINEEQMSIYETSRWFCLLDALDVITKKSRELKIDLADDKSSCNWVKPIALQKYIEERLPSVVLDVENEHLLGKL